MYLVKVSARVGILFVPGQMVGQLLSHTLVALPVLISISIILTHAGTVVQELQQMACFGHSKLHRW
jgi:hypothetical protein